MTLFSLRGVLWSGYICVHGLDWVHITVLVSQQKDDFII